jgi:hypothetical protein
VNQPTGRTEEEAAIVSMMRPIEQEHFAPALVHFNLSIVDEYKPSHDIVAVLYDQAVIPVGRREVAGEASHLLLNRRSAESSADEVSHVLSGQFLAWQAQ